MRELTSTWQWWRQAALQTSREPRPDYTFS